MAEAMHRAVSGNTREALDSLHALLDRPDMPFSGWTIPIEPLLMPLHAATDYQRLTDRLADRAR
jgi:hypothetical protein